MAYAAYLHARATPSVKRTTATWFAVAAWGTMLINLYVINFVAVGLHSYAGVDEPYSYGRTCGVRTRCAGRLGALSR